MGNRGNMGNRGIGGIRENKEIRGIGGYWFSENIILFREIYFIISLLLISIYTIYFVLSQRIKKITIFGKVN